MMRKLLSLSVIALLAAALTHPALAQDKKGAAKAAPSGKAAAMKGGAKGATMAAAGGETKISGMVKGSPSGKSFTVGTRKGPVKVDASGAKVRVNGKFAKLDVLTGGTQVNVTGTMSGDTLKAKDVDAHPRKSGGAATKGGAAKGADKGAKTTPAAKK
jgi:hypothetical protein